MHPDLGVRVNLRVHVVVRDQRVSETKREEISIKRSIAEPTDTRSVREYKVEEDLHVNKFLNLLICEYT